MKLIDLLNKISKGEEVPKMVTANKIEDCEDMIFIYDENIQDYVTKDKDYLFEMIFNKSFPVLNKEIEPIEEEKEIEEINKSYPIIDFNKESFEAMKEMVQDIYSKQCEIIRELNKIKKEGK